MIKATTEAEPFLKWAGGKRRLLPLILPHLPPLEEGSCYFEPFLGGGAVFFSIAPRLALLSDSNRELIDTFVTVRDEADAVIRILAGFRNNEPEFYRIRASTPRTSYGRAARFIYLNKLCFNGLYRVNNKGEFNVPYGRHPEAVVYCDKQQLMAASEALAGTTILVSDFEDAIFGASSGDVVYFDPPYTTAHIDNGFIEYNARVFSWEDQERLANVAHALIENGVRVVVSNADHPSIRRLYPRSKGFEAHRIARSSTIAGSSKARATTTELVFTSGGYSA